MSWPAPSGASGPGPGDATRWLCSEGALMATYEVTPSDEETVAAIARRHGLALAGDIELNDLGLDFRAAFASDEGGTAWVLRIPRRLDVLPRAENEARVLGLVKRRLPVEVPDWWVV